MCPLLLDQNNGLGFSDKPLSLTPHFFETKALESLFRPGIKAEYFNRHKLGKVLDAAHGYGCESLFFELSSQSCVQEHIDLTFTSEDTTTFSLTGEYSEDTDENTITLTQGYSKDHRPDLKQVVQELLVSQDGGIPLMMKSWDGNASDTTIFKERACMLIDHFKQTTSPRYLVADSKLYSQGNAVNLSHLTFITRIPGNIKDERVSIVESLKADKWETLNKANKYYEKQLTHYGIAQRWLVVYSDKARARSKKTLEKAIKKELNAIETQLWHLSKQPYECAKDAEKAAGALLKYCHYHKLSASSVSVKNVYASLGRPKKGSEPTGVHYFVTVGVEQDSDAIETRLNEKSCYVIGTNIAVEALSSAEVIAAYKRQNSSIENMGFRFLKDPLFFVSSLFLKKPSRIMGLLMVMTLSLLVYSIAQRRMRKALEATQQTLPNQIKLPTRTPTLRWLFQLMEGIHVVTLKVGDVLKTIVQGLTELKRKIIRLLGETVMRIYCLQENIDSSLGGSSM